MRIKKVNFEGSLTFRLGAQLDLPDEGDPRAFALFAHCFTCTKNLKAVKNINKALTEEGIAVLRFDFTGLGESEGDFSDTNFSSNISDLIAAARFLEANYRAPEILIGHSLGGTAVLQTASHIPSVVAVATFGAPFDPGHVTSLFTGSKKEIEEKGEAEVNIGGRPFRIKKQFLDDLKSTSLDNTIRTLKRSLAVFHSPVDTVVGIDSAQKIFMAAKHPKSFISLDNADHLLMNEKDSCYVGDVISAWAGRYL